MFVNTTKDEREFAKRETLRSSEMIYNSDVIRKIAEDDGYRYKVQIIEAAISLTKGWILGIGSGTSGEDEYLSTKGYKIISTDINELALALSKKRSRKFNRERYEYVACDAQNLSLATGEISLALFNESLHHLPDPLSGLREVFRVLEPDGKVFMLEPYAYDPWRRISEVRDYFKGTVETSFSVGGLKKLVNRAGLVVTHVERVVFISRAKLSYLHPLHRVARIAYYEARRAIPGVFGMIALTAKKPAEETRVMRGQISEFIDLFRCPISGSRLRYTGDGFVTTDPEHRVLYPVVDGIPVLIADDGERLSEDAWKNLISRIPETGVPFLTGPGRRS